MSRSVTIRASSSEQESRFTKAEALEWAECYYKANGTWPQRRFRVDGTSAGNSKLLRHKDADKAKLKYGGQVVEMIPEAKYYRDLCRIEGRPCVMGMPRSNR